MSKIKITINDIEESLYSLDTEYREALARALMDLNYVSDSPLNLSLGTEKQQQELQKVYETPLKAKQVKEIIRYISKEMKGDFQYGSFVNIASRYNSLADKMNKNMER